MSTETENAVAAKEDMVSFEVDGQTLQAEKGSMLIRATDAAGIYIPRFCYHKNLPIAANCRMCLVEVEKAPKPLPACATPVMEGMKVFTQSDTAKTAQQGVMEFLLINHPLDCPICDQGGECQLQDLAVGYGNDNSRYLEAKRVVIDKNIGPLISTEMTRCIHCTRCVRFGQEVAGIMEMGATGRGEDTKIGTYIENSIDSELSGNIIDLCPVGALTSKPFRYSARPWELVKRASISPHDSVGANLTVHTRDNKVMRVVARENQAVNETWISDRDRFSYEANDHADRLTSPMIKVDNQWQETDWNSALEFALRGLSKVIDRHGADNIGGLAAPHCSTEEFYLLQKFMRAMGSGNVDHRTGQMDFSDDDLMPAFPGLGQSLESLEASKSILIIGSNVRKDQPLIGLRIRKAQQAGASLNAINPVDYEFTHQPDNKFIGTPQQMLESLAGVVKALATETKKSLPDEAASIMGKITPGETEQAIAKNLLSKTPASILLGSYAISNSYSSQFRALCQLAAQLSGAKLGLLAQANSAGAWLAGCVPHRGANNSTASKTGAAAHDMIKEPLKAYITMGLEPEQDCIDAGRARLAMEAAEFNVMITSFKPASDELALDSANVMLPMATYFETAGTHVNCEGKAQAYNSTVTPPGESRPAWKILRVLGNYFELDGFDQDSINDVRNELKLEASQNNSDLLQVKMPKVLGGKILDLYRLAELPIYRVDSMVRRAAALQKTSDSPGPNARVNSMQAAKLSVAQGDTVRVRMLEGDAQIQIVIDERIPDACIWIPNGFSETSALGACGSASVSKL